jgi:hypothetical protein
MPLGQGRWLLQDVGKTRVRPLNGPATLRKAQLARLNALAHPVDRRSMAARDGTSGLPFSSNIFISLWTDPRGQIAVRNSLDAIEDVAIEEFVVMILFPSP